MTTIYTDIDECLQRAKNRARIPNDLQDELILELLGTTAGVVEEVAYYRPYYVAALLLEQDIAKQNLKKAGDVEFTQLAGVIQSLRVFQNSLDISLGISVPLGLEAVAATIEATSFRAGLPASSKTLRNYLVF